MPNDFDQFDATPAQGNAFDTFDLATVQAPVRTAAAAPSNAFDAFDAAPAPADDGILDTLLRLPGRAARGLASGGESLLRLGNLAGMPAATLIDTLHGQVTGTDQYGARDWVGDQVTETDRRAGNLALDRNTEPVNMGDEIAFGVGRMAPDVVLAALTRGESAIAPVVQQGVRPMVLREIEHALATGSRAGLVPGASRGAEVATDVIDQGGTTAEAVGAGGTAGLATGVTNAIPASASGNVLMRALQGIIANPVADRVQTVSENAALPDYLGMDQETTLKDDIVSAIIGAPTSAVMGERGHERINNPDAVRGPDLDLAELQPQPAAPNPLPPAPVAAPRQGAPESGVAGPVNPAEIVAQQRMAAQAQQARAGDVATPATPITNPAPPAEPVRTPAPADATPPPDRLHSEEDKAAAKEELRKALEAFYQGPGEGVDFGSDKRADDAKLDEALALDDATYLQRINPSAEKTVPDAQDSLISELADREVPERAKPVATLDGGITLHADGDYLYASDGDRVVGVLGAKPSGNEFAVDPEYQGRGIGTAMMKELLVREPMALSGGLSDAAERTRIAARNQLREERAQRVPAEPTAPAADSAPVAQPVTTKPDVAPPLRDALPDDDGTGVDHATQTSLKNEVRNEARGTRGEEPLLTVDTKANQAVVDEARAELERDPSVGRRTVERIIRTGEGSLKDEGILLAEDVRLRKLRDAAEARAGDESLSPEERAEAQVEASEHEAAITQLDQAARAVGTEGARILQFRKQVIANDFTVQSIERKMRAVRGRELTAEERTTARETADKVADLQRRLDTSEAARADAETRAAVSDTYAALVRALSGGRKGGALVDKLKTRADAAKARLAASSGVRNPRNQGGAVDAGMLADLADIGAYHIVRGVTNLADFVRKVSRDFAAFAGMGEPVHRDVFDRAQAAARAEARDSAQIVDDIDGAVTHKDVYDLAAAALRAGIKGEDAVMASVHRKLKDAGHDLTERDVRRLFSEYGKARFPSPDATKKELRELRALVQLQESIDRLEEGLAPMKSGPQRDKVTADVAAKRKQLAAALKKLAAQGKADPERVAAYNAMRAENLRKQIDALDRQIVTGESADRKRNASTPSAEVKRLTELRDRLKDDLAAIDAGNRRNEAEKRALRKKIADVEAQMRGEAPAPRGPESRVDDADTTALRTKLDTLRAQQSDATAGSARATQLGEQIAELMRRLAGKPGADKPAPRAESQPELARIRDELQAQLKALENPPKPAEQRFQERMAKLLQNRIRDVRARLAAEDFAPRKRVPRELNAANEKLAFELAQAKTDFARRQFDAEMAQRHPIRKILGFGADVMNTARAMMTSLDLSAVFRQGGFIAFGHPVRAARAFVPMLKAAVSAQKEHAINEEIANRPNAKLYKRAGLELTEHNNHLPSKMEEAYMSRWIDKLPTVLGGGLLRGSQRAYTTFLNKLRADSFDAMHAALVRSGEGTEAEIKAIANYINVATGRGHIGRKNTAAVGLNTVFFAPRLVASRFNLLAGQPLYGGSGRTRKLVAQEYARFLMGVAAVYGLAALSADDDDDWLVTLDPRSSDFGKIRFGHTYIDPLTGLAQVTAILGKEITGQKVTMNGDVRDLHEVGLFTAGRDDVKHGFGQDTGFGVLMRFMRTKLAPVPGAITDQLDFGTNVVGEDVDPADSALSLVTPMSFRDIAKVMEDNGVPQGTAITLAGLLGMGVQYRDPHAHDKKEDKGN